MQKTIGRNPSGNLTGSSSGGRQYQTTQLSNKVTTRKYMSLVTKNNTMSTEQEKFREKTSRPSQGALDQGDFKNITPGLENYGSASIGVVEQFFVNLWRRQEMCDLVLKVGRYELHAHKLLLAAYSQQFADQCVVESPTGPCEISLNDSTVEATQQILRYIYTNHISITALNVDSVISGARQLGVTDVLVASGKYLRHFTQETVLNFMWTAEKHEYKAVFAILYDFVCRNFGIISRTEAFLSCSVDKVRRLLQDDNLNVEGELDMYFTATNWLDYNRQERIKYTLDVLKTVRFALIVPDDIVKYVEPNIQLYSEECGIMLTNVFRYHALRYSGGGLDRNLPRSRKYVSLEGHKSQTEHINYTQNNSQVNTQNKNNEKINVQTVKQSADATNSVFLTFGGIDSTSCSDDGHQTGRLVEEYNTSTDSWNLVTKLPDSRQHQGLAILDEYFYLVGGKISGENEDYVGTTSACYSYSYTENYWSRIADLLEARSHHGVATLNGILYAVGGLDTSERDMDSVEYFNPDTEAWNIVTSLSECKRNVSTIGYQGLLYCIGGYRDDCTKGDKSVLATVECFNPLDSLWTQKEPISIARCYANVVNVNEKLFLIGGSTFYSDIELESSLDSVLRYNETADQWELFCYLNVPRHDCGCTSLGNKIYIFGGATSTANEDLDDVTCLDIESGDCQIGLQRLTSRSRGITCCTLPDAN